MKSGTNRWLALLAFTLILIGAVGSACPVVAAPVLLVPQLSNFAVLGGSGTVTNTGCTKLCGDLGISPGTAITDEANICVKGVKACVGGNPSVFKDCAVAVCAHRELASVESCVRLLPGSLDAACLTNQILLPGVYKFASNALLPTGQTLKLCGNNCPNAFWIFCVDSCLTACSNSRVVVQNTSEACPEILWNVGTSATIGTGAAFRGDILACQSITLDTGATINDGAALALVSVTMDANIVNVGSPAAGGGPGSGAPELNPDAVITPLILILVALLVLFDHRCVAR